ncbi:MAG: hypothetical protein HYV33_00340 [Candidatus Kerfeldbacteria bacterium]|nr:hypothetical protein [Candidatus Kerfeldbacteria bacterium]
MLLYRFIVKLIQPYYRAIGVLVVMGSMVVSMAGCGKASDGGVFRSSDGGSSWEQKTFISQEGRKIKTINDVNVTTIVTHPTDHQLLYLGTKANGLYVSFDSGDHWVTTALTTGHVSAIAIDQTQPDIVFIAHDRTIKKSTDGGVTWEVMHTDPKNGRLTSVIIDYYDHTKIYASSTSGTVVKSVDEGQRWDLRLQLDDSIQELLMANHDTKILYALDDDGRLFKTTNGGEQDPLNEDEDKPVNSGWIEVFDKAFRSQFNATSAAVDIALDRNDSTILYMAAKRGIMRGSNNATQWEDITTLLGYNDKRNESIRNLIIVPGNSTTLYFTLDNGIQKSTDAGNSWEIIETFPSTRRISAVLIDPTTTTTLYAGTEFVEEKKGLIR